MKRQHDFTIMKLRRRTGLGYRIFSFELCLMSCFISSVLYIHSVWSDLASDHTITSGAAFFNTTVLVSYRCAASLFLVLENE